MNVIRRVKRIMKSQPTIEGAGVHLRRAFGFHEVPALDPFLLLDDFHSDNPSDYIRGFPWHPHRGIETITYVLHGRVEHGDSMGNKGIIGSGDVQWMTAGSGIVHQEMPKGEESGLMWGFQLWANLPASQKMMAPRYRDVRNDQIPETKVDTGVRVRIIAGEVKGVEGPVQDIVIDPEYLDVTMQAKSTLRHPAKRGRTVFAYTLEGSGHFGQRRDPYDYDVIGANYFDLRRDDLFSAEALVLFDDGDLIHVLTESQPFRFLLISGNPIGEPVAWYGPIVMNTQEELRVAFEEYEKGTFLKHAGAA